METLPVLYAYTHTHTLIQTHPLFHCGCTLVMQAFPKESSVFHKDKSPWLNSGGRERHSTVVSGCVSSQTITGKLEVSVCLLLQ